MLHPHLYTSGCTKLVSASSLPLTIADWQAAYRAGASPADVLLPLRRRLAERTSDVAILRLVSPAELDAQLATLSRAVAAHPDADALRIAMPLYGVPFALKDNIDVVGVETTAACPAFAHVADQSANVVRRLVAAGAVWIAKTNLDQFATGLVGTRSPYGAPASCFADDRISGGSSSGSAVVVARGDVPFSLGTDTAGSGRIPAGFNQLVGLKPTPGRVGTSGVLPACRSLDCVSIFAHTVDDAAAVLAVLEGPDGEDPYSRFAPGRAELPAILRVGVPAAPAFFGDAGYDAAWAAARDALSTQGHQLVPIDLAPLDEVAALLYEGPWVAERHAVVDDLLRTRPEAFDPVVRGVIGAALGYSATDAFRGQYRLRTLAAQAEAMWDVCDVMMVPTAPGHPRFTEVAADPVGVNTQLGRYTNFVNLLGWCALAVPAGAASHGLPFGVTFIAAGNDDAALARVGRAWQHELGTTMGATGVALPPSVRGSAWPQTEPALPIAVVGAHLSGLPLNTQLVERGATLVETTTTAPRYRLHALAGTVPAKPGLVRDSAAGHAIAVEVWAMPMQRVGDFLALIPPPLGLGSIELADGRTVHGFLCENDALVDSPDISSYGGWRAYLASRDAAAKVAA